MPTFELFFERVALSNKSADRACKSPTRVHFEARNNLADDTRRGRVDFAWKLFGDMWIRETVGLAPVTPHALCNTAAVNTIEFDSK